MATTGARSQPGAMSRFEVRAPVSDEAGVSRLSKESQRSAPRQAGRPRPLWARLVDSVGELHELRFRALPAATPARTPSTWSWPRSPLERTCRLAGGPRSREEGWARAGAEPG